MTARLPFPPQTLDLSSASLHVRAGERTARGARTIGQAGAMVFGPYWSLPRGAYRLTARHRPLTPDARETHATLHVWHGLGVHHVAATPISRDGTTLLTFALGHDVDDIEFVIMVEAEAMLEFDRYELAALTPVGTAPEDRVRRQDFGQNLPFRHVVSLGTHCYTASLLQRQGWKRFSGPFDWIFSTPAMVRHCIEDDFKTLLDRTQYETIPVEARSDPGHGFCHHRYYREAYGLDPIFNHHDVGTDEGYRYIQRCVARFREVVHGPDPVLLLQARWEEPDSAAQFAETCKLIDARFQACTLNAFMVRPTPSSGVCPDLRLRGRRNAHRLFEVTPVSVWEATAFQDPLDELVLARLVRFHRFRLDPPAGEG